MPAACSSTPSAASPVADDLTEDSLLGGRVRFAQPRAGYRVAIDPVLLAAAVPAVPGEVVLDAGAGTGAAALCLAARVTDCRIVGIEAQRDLQRIASRNVAANGAGARIDLMVGDLERPPPRLTGASFDHVMTNPPFHAAASGTVSPHPGRATAHVEGLDLERWISACLRMLKPGGRLTLIHRADRLDEVLAALCGRIGDLVVFPLWPTADDRPAKRVVVQGRKSAQGPLRLARGLVLHERDGRYTEAAAAVLREARLLALVPERRNG
jgi:tRNA1(Val) A37 N6-methylase TrmN6